MTDEEVLEQCNKISGWMFDDELLWLYQQAQSADVIVEIGVWQGRSTTALCLGTPGTVYAIDHWQGSPAELGDAHQMMTIPDGRYQVFSKAIENLFPLIDQGKCVPLTLASYDAALLIGPMLQDIGGADMIFLDGGHDAESFREDLIVWSEHLREGRMICGHDRHWPGVQSVLNEVLPGYKSGPGSIWFHIGGQS